jgi:hypothetical protein
MRPGTTPGCAFLLDDLLGLDDTPTVRHYTWWLAVTPNPQPTCSKRAMLKALSLRALKARFVSKSSAHDLSKLRRKL